MGAQTKYKKKGSASDAKRRVVRGVTGYPKLDKDGYLIGSFLVEGPYSANTHQQVRQGKTVTSRHRYFPNEQYSSKVSFLGISQPSPQ